MTAILGSSVVAMWLAVHALGHAVFRENQLFALRTINVVRPSHDVSKTNILDILRLRIGDSIFQINLNQARRVVLDETPRLKDIEISRRLPDLLQVLTVERVPMASLKMDGFMLGLDAEGYVLGPVDADRRLPLITGHNLVGLRPGARLDGTPVMQALEVLNVCADTPLGQELRVTRIDVRKGDMLNLLLEEGAEVALAWHEMRAHTDVSLKNLKLKLTRLAAIRQQGRSFSNLDMTFDNNYPAR
ncbi:MAG: cell division protein FtsQ/DivIB [Kiritimatiellia bacterium]|nr:FtsQ-type POTRA domain-containing protein [Lentisphaerota bacterium]